MKKIWLGGKAYRLSDEQDQQLQAELDKKLQHHPNTPNGKGKEPISESENIALKWIKDNEIDVAMSILFIVGLFGTLLDLLTGQHSGFMLAQILIPAITTGAGINTPSAMQTQLESDVLLGDIDTTMPLRGLKVNVDGDTTIDVQNSNPLMTVLAKLSQFLTASVVGLILKIATGRVFCRAAQIIVTNDGATTPTLYWNSQQGGGSNPGRLIRASTTQINPNSNQTFIKGKFAYLTITDPANVNSVDFTFSDGTQQNMAIVEVDALFAKTNETEANGRLQAACSCIDNTRGNISMVRINVGAVAITVMIVL